MAVCGVSSWAIIVQRRAVRHKYLALRIIIPLSLLRPSSTFARMRYARRSFLGLALLVGPSVGACAPRSAPAIVRSTTTPPAPTTGTSPTTDARPALIVLITIDQMRADYLDRFGPQLRGGLARLVAGGARFTNAHHDHAITETAPGHATLLSGRFPRSTGIMMNRVGVDDVDAPLVAGAYGTGASPKRFVGTTLADWLRDASARTRTLSVSMKDRGAILPIGTSKSDVYWYSADGRFTTSTYYRSSLPKWVNSFNERQLPFTYAGKRWSLLLPDSAYHEKDSVLVEGGGVDVVFPHALPADPVDAGSMVRATPFMDDLVLAFALHGVNSLALGKSGQTDLLSVSLSATDVIGHRFGPDSREIHDQILRVDRALGVFLDSLYALRDSSTVTVVLTADHGVGTIPELAPDSIQPRPTRVNLYGLLRPLIARMVTAKVDTNAIDLDEQILLMNRGAFKNRAFADSLVDAFAVAARQMPGVLRVDRFRSILGDSLNDPVARRWSHQFPAMVPVELVITLTRLSTFGGNVASHGSPHDYDSHVPLLFYGAGIQPGVYAEFVRTVDIAPTLALLAGVKPLERVDGIVLKRSLK